MSATPQKSESPAPFAFDAETAAKARQYIARYPEGRQASAVLYLLYLGQRQNGGWVSQAVIEHVAGVLDMAPIRVHEVASFFTMFNKQPVGKYLLQVCGTTPCWLRGSDDVFAACKQELGIGKNETTKDGLFTIVEVECLGACVNAPMMQVNDDFYEDLTKQNTLELLKALKRGEPPKPGSLVGRQSSEPMGGPTTLAEFVKAKKG